MQSFLYLLYCWFYMLAMLIKPAYKMMHIRLHVRHSREVIGYKECVAMALGLAFYQLIQLVSVT